MSNNEPDYENNLAFAPQEIKSQDFKECNTMYEDTRSTLALAIEKCEKLEDEIKKYKTILLCIDSERLPAGCYKADYEHSMKSINWVFENMLDDKFNPIEELDK